MDLFTPDGAFTGLIVFVGLTLLVAAGFLVVFGGATLLP